MTGNFTGGSSDTGAAIAGLEAVIRSRPVFVVGCPRSGTTLVQTMLDYHPRLSVLYEANALIDIPLGLRSCLATASEALRLAEAHPNSPAHHFEARTAYPVCEELGIMNAAGAMRVLAAAQALAQGKRRWGTKTPKGVLHLAELASVYPDAQFIHVIRDGRDAASSQARVSDRSLIQGALLWRTAIRSARRTGLGLGPDRYLEVRLEDFLVSPERYIRRICAFLGEEFDQSLLQFHTTARARIPRSDLSIHPRLGEAPRPSPVSRERAAVGLTQRAAAALMDTELVELGYLPADRSRCGWRLGYVIVGYTFLVISLRRNLPDLLRYFARYGGARRAARNLAGRRPRRGGRPPRVTTLAIAEPVDES